MKQELFKSSVRGRFIKNLLCNTYIPTYDTVRPGDYIIKNCKYVYNISLIQCTKSGTLEGTGEFITLDYTFYWDAYKVNESQRFTSNTGYYDSETHEWLGNYLRAYRDMKGINLMPFYNCFSGVYTDRFKLKTEVNTKKYNSLSNVVFKFNDTLNTTGMGEQIYPSFGVIENSDIGINDEDGHYDSYYIKEYPDSSRKCIYFKCSENTAYYIVSTLNPQVNHYTMGYSEEIPSLGSTVYQVEFSGDSFVHFTDNLSYKYIVINFNTDLATELVKVCSASVFDVHYESTADYTGMNRSSFNKLIISSDMLAYMYKSEYETYTYYPYENGWMSNGGYFDAVPDTISIVGGTDSENDSLISWILFNGVTVYNTSITKQRVVNYLSVYQSSSSYDTYTQGTKEFNDAYMEKTPYKLFRVPVKFNRTYTIALDCGSTIKIAPAFVNHGKLLEVSIGSKKLSLTDLYIQNKDSNGNIHPISVDLTNSEFIHPFVFSLPNNNQTKVSNVVAVEDVGLTYEQLFQRYEKYLYLLIQIPKDNASGLVILEGNYLEAPVNKVFSNETIGEQSDVEFYNKQTRTYFVESCERNMNTNMINPITNKPNPNYISSCQWVTRVNTRQNTIKFAPDGTLSTQIFDVEILNKNGNPLDYNIGYTEYHFSQEEMEEKGAKITVTILSIYSWIPLSAGMRVKITYSNDSHQSAYFPYDPRNDDSFLDSMLLSKLSLLQFNDNVSYPFADVLIEYLLSNVIDSADEISDNIKRIQMWFGVQNSPEFTYGAWNNALRIDVFNTAKYINTIPHMDMIGYVDKNIESTTL